MTKLRGVFAQSKRQVNVKAKAVEGMPYAGKKSCTRKSFMAGSFAFAACGRLFAATGGAPNLRLGVVSDIHFRLEPKTRKLRKDWDEATFVHALIALFLSGVTS